MRSLVSRMWKQLQDDSGQGMVEYILIIGLIVLFIVAALMLFKDTIRDFINKVKDWIGGQEMAPASGG